MELQKRRRITWTAIGGLVLLFVIVAFWPGRVSVDVATATQGPMTVTVDEEGVTRIRDIFTIYAPVSGKVLRSPRHVGDLVVAQESVVAVIQPLAPSFLDARTRRELESAVKAAQAAVTLAEAEVRRAKSELTFAEHELKRAKALSTDVVSPRTLEQRTVEAETKRAAVAQAEANLDAQMRALEAAEARLIGPENVTPTESDSCCIEITAPVSGRVLSLVDESEQVVAAGAELLQIGDPSDLEIVVELLSTEAVQVETGAAATIDGWGGQTSLGARVRRVDPAGFKKISALGIEEQRVNVFLDFVDPDVLESGLGHDFRVYAHIHVWSADSAVQVPLGALFRHQGNWALFRVEDGRAMRRTVKIGHRNADVAEILDGVSPGDLVVLYPNDQIDDGTRVSPR